MDESFSKPIETVKLCYCEVHSVETGEDLKTILILCELVGSSQTQECIQLDNMQSHNVHNSN